MNFSERPADGDSPFATELNGEPFRLRSYQAEMVEESLRSNIICVMDTGSGKTHIAIERARAELESCQPDKLVWFLAPTVTLCEQQYEVFKSNLPGYGIQLLSGNDNLDHWTDQSVWDTVLHNIRIVLSTHQVLVDALTHAFVKMSRLALLIFDEAHHCTRNHPAHNIMSKFYMPRLESSSTHIPKILGLSASPVMKAKATSVDLQQIERNLCATARTPKLHRSELMRYVHRPQLIRIDHPVDATKDTRSALFIALQFAYVNYNLENDPYVSELLRQQQEGYDTSRPFKKVMLSGKTYCSDQLKALVAKAEAMSQELGSSPMEWYLHQCIARFEKMVNISDLQMFDWTVSEKQHLLRILKQLPLVDPPLCQLISWEGLSQKAELLVEILVTEARENAQFTGLVFVEQRVWVATLAEILANHPRTRNLFQIGTFVGTSRSNKREANIAAFAEPRNQQSTLDDFRAGRTNLILTTSVLEEGIDVSSCNLVICFERPKNLKSFVQRRGRARQQESKYLIFIPEVSGGQSPESWQSLEEEMRAAYLDDMRQVQLAEERELEDEGGERFFSVPNTGALLTLGNASQHLHHFCAILGSGPYVDTRPEFQFSETETGAIAARVILPISVDPSVRAASSLESWRTERMAKNDAAFEAYKALYLAGLVNENLLPARQGADDKSAEFQKADNRPSLVEVSPTLDPWSIVARCQRDSNNIYYRTLLRAQASGEEPIYMLLFTSTPMPTVPKLPLFWNESKQYTIYNSWIPSVALDDDEVDVLRSITHDVLYSIFSGRMQADRRDFLWLVAPCDSEGHNVGSIQMLEWHIPVPGAQPATELISQGWFETQSWGLVSRQGDQRKYIVKAISMNCSSSSLSTAVPQLQMIRLPKRRDFLHPVERMPDKSDAYTRIEEVAASECLVDNLPARYVVFALLLPSILHSLEVYMVAETLRTTLLKPVAFDTAHLSHIIRALTSSSTGENNNYQRLEFLGDCILKFITSVHLMADNLTDPEGFLTGKKGRMVSNGYLARATLAAGLDKFIITKRFTGAKWAPKYTGDLLAETESPKKIEKSSKLIADVIESLIGVSYVVGGFAKAFACVQTLLPLEPWMPISEASNILYDAAPVNDTLTNFPTLETLIGHTFGKKMLLLEALTHGSYSGPNAHCSYNRLEFLGDAVLDYIISRRLYAHEPPLPHQKMHAMRTAMVNASFLTFSMFETSVLEATTNKTTMQPELQNRALWHFLRSGRELIGARDSAQKQHELVKQRVAAALERDARFPWHLLALTDPPKFLSDIVESVIGAVYVDSHGDISACEVFVRRLGILDCLEHILRDGVDCLHPKERLGHLAVERKVQYVRVTEDKKAHSDCTKLYRCQVKIGGEDVGGVEEGMSRLTSETIAAWKAIRILELANDVFMVGVEGGSEEEDVFFDAEDGGVMNDDW